MKRFTLITLVGMLLFCGIFAFGGLTRNGYESPDYKVVQKAAGWEIRDYPEMSLVTTEVADVDARGNDGSFMRLFRYIDGGNDESQKIAMTTPVFMAAKGENEKGEKSGKMSFVIPTEVVKEGVPAAKDGLVKVETLKSARYAALRFRSRSKDEEAANKLRDLVEAAGIQISKDVKPIFAYYDPPWTPAALRRNEVLLQLPDKAVIAPERLKELPAK